MLPPRLAETILVAPGIDEAGLYADIVRRVRAAATGSGRTRLALRGLTRLAGSSPAAAAPTLAKLGWNDLAERARAIREPDKVRVLVERLVGIGATRVLADADARALVVGLDDHRPGQGGEPGLVVGA